MASFHAGYAASVCIQQTVAQQILHIYYADGDIPAAAINQVIIPVPGRPAVTISSNLFLAEPQLIFQPEAKNRAGVSVRFYGTFTFNAPGIVSLTANVTVRATLFCPVAMTEQTDGYRFSIQLNKGDVTDFAIVIMDGNNPKNRFGLDLDDPGVAAAIKTVLLLQPDRNIFFTYPLLSQLTKTGLSVSKVAIKPLAGALVIGIDLQERVNKNGVEQVTNITTGNFALLHDYCKNTTEGGWTKDYGPHRVGEDENGQPVYVYKWGPTNPRGPVKHDAAIGTSVNVVAMKYVFERYARFQIMQRFEDDKKRQVDKAIEYAQQHNTAPKYPEISTLTLNNIGIEMKDNHFVIHANVTSRKKVELTTDVHMKMRLLWTRATGDTGYTSQLQHLNGVRAEVFDLQIDEPDLVDTIKVIGFIIGFVAAVFSPFIGLFLIFAVAIITGSVIPSFIEAVEKETLLKLNAEMETQHGGTTFLMPGTEAPLCSVGTQDILVQKDGISAWFRFTPKTDSYPAIKWNSSSLEPGTWPVDDRTPIQLNLSLPKGYFHPKDPLVRVRWEVFANDQLLAQRDDNVLAPPAGINPFQFNIDHDQEGWEKFNSFKVRCRMYRPWGDFTEDIYNNASMVIKIADTLDRTKKFVKWGPYTTLYKTYLRNSQGDILYGRPTWKSLKRTPKIHKTDIDVRCKFVAHHTEYTSLEYFDNLPFPPGKLKENRNLLCDYCFFGGPDKKNPKPDN